MPLLRYQLYPGQLVMHQGILSRVEKINPKKIVVMHEDGRRWNTYPDYLELAPEGATFNLDEAKGLTLGSVVEFMGEPEKGKYAVIALRGAHAFNLAKLGGDSNRYYREVPASRLLEVEVPAVLR